LAQTRQSLTFPSFRPPVKQRAFALDEFRAVLSHAVLRENVNMVSATEVTQVVEDDMMAHLAGFHTHPQAKNCSSSLAIASFLPIGPSKWTQ
jgi:hypothetical protein